MVEEIISSAVIKFSKRFPEASVEVKMPEEFLMVAMDGVLIEQVLVNLLENAVLHGKTYTKIWIVVTHTPGGWRSLWRTMDRESRSPCAGHV